VGLKHAHTTFCLKHAEQIRSFTF